MPGGQPIENLELDCTVNIEKLTETGHVVSCQKVSSCTITLGRNELREIVVKISPVKGGRTQEIVMTEVRMFKTFLRDGKSTIRSQNKIQLLISNCPPDRLAQFLKMLAIKTGIKKSRACDRTKLYSSLPKHFEGISPLTEKECQLYLDIHKPTIEKKDKKKLNQGYLSTTPKRKRVCDGIQGLPKKKLNCTSDDRSVALESLLGNQGKSKLTQEQCMVLEAVRKGSNVFFTGSAGTGKSFLLKRIVGSLPPSETVICGSTGVAASHIGGITLHSFAGNTILSIFYAILLHYQNIPPKNCG